MAKYEIKKIYENEVTQRVSGFFTQEQIKKIESLLNWAFNPYKRA